MYLVLFLKLNGDLSLIFRPNAGLAVMLPQSLSLDSSNQQPGAHQQWEGGLCSSVLVIKAGGAHFPRGNIWLEFTWWAWGYYFQDIVISLLWHCRKWHAATARNYVIFLMSKILPAMISCHSFPVSEGAAAPLAAHFRKKVKSTGRLSREGTRMLEEMTSLGFIATLAAMVCPHSL